MPRTISFQVFKFEELSDTAKEKAREWWCDLERQDPAWYEEHFASMNAAIKELPSREYDDNEDAFNKEAISIFKDLIAKAEGCKLTGYSADIFAAEAFKSFIDDIAENEYYSFENASCHITLLYEKKWEEEISSRLEDNEYVDENITTNDYEFLEDGSFYKRR